MEEMSNDSKKGGKGQRDRPAEDGMWWVKEKVKGGKIVRESFFFQTARDFEAGDDEECAYSPDTPRITQRRRDGRQESNEPNKDMAREITNERAELEGAEGEEYDACTSLVFR